MTKLSSAIVVFYLAFVGHICDASEIYKWVDESGKIHYGNKPPQTTRAERVDKGGQVQKQEKLPLATEPDRIQKPNPAKSGATSLREEGKRRANEARSKAKTRTESLRNKTDAPIRIGTCLIQPNTICTKPIFKDVDLSGAKLSGASLTDADFSGANLTKVDFRNAKLLGAKFDGAILRDTNIGSADLSNADLRNVRIENTSFSFVKLQGANLSGVDFSGIDLSYADLRGAMLNGTRLENARIYNIKQTINGCEVTKQTKCPGANLKGALLIGIELENADLSGADLTGASLKEASLKKVNLARANLTGADLTRATFNEVNMEVAVLDKVKADDAMFYNVNLTRAKIREATFIRGRFNSAVNFEDADFSRANLAGAGFGSSVNLKNTNFDRSILTGAMMSSVDVSKAIFGGARMDGCTGCPLSKEYKAQIVGYSENMRKNFTRVKSITDLPGDAQAVIAYFEKKNSLGIKISGNPIYIAELKTASDPTVDRHLSMLSFGDTRRASYITHKKPQRDNEGKCARLIIGITTSLTCPENYLCREHKIPAHVKQCALHTNFDLSDPGYITWINCDNGYRSGNISNGFSYADGSVAMKYLTKEDRCFLAPAEAAQPLPPWPH